MVRFFKNKKGGILTCPTAHPADLTSAAKIGLLNNLQHLTHFCECWVPDPPTVCIAFIHRPHITTGHNSDVQAGGRAACGLQQGGPEPDNPRNVSDTEHA